MPELAIRGGTPVRTEPFPQYPQSTQACEDNLLQVLRSGRWSRTGHQVAGQRDAEWSFVGRLEALAAATHSRAYALAVSSGSAALDIAVKAAGMGPGDEVLVTPYTFVSTAAAIVHAGAVPVFCDIDPDTWNLDPEHLGPQLTSRTRGVVVVHFAGQTAPMSAINAFAREHGLSVIEDAAHAFGATSDIGPIGTGSTAACFSLQSSKNVTSGEGGLLVTDDPEVHEAATSLHSCGRDANGPWYRHSRIGWNYRLTEFQAAVACAALEDWLRLDQLRERHAKKLIQLLTSTPGLTPNWQLSPEDPWTVHLVGFRYDLAQWGGLTRRRFLMALNAEGIPCHEGYPQPLYATPAIASLVEQGLARRSDCPSSEAVCASAIWFHQDLLLGSQEDVATIADAVHKVRGNLGELVRV
jgi:dTDP-4-amino-4,6-dideoxygalactose transaminase